MTEHIPYDAIPAPGEVVIELRPGGPDGYGRRPFFANWISGTVGYSRNERGVHSQAFCTRPEEFIANTEAEGFTVRYADPAG